MAKILAGRRVWDQRISLTSFSPHFSSFNPLYPCSMFFYVMISWVQPQRGRKGTGNQSWLYSQVLERPCTPSGDTWDESQGRGLSPAGVEPRGSMRTLGMCLRWWPGQVHKRRESMERVSLAHLTVIRSWSGAEREGKLWWVHRITLVYSFTWVVCAQLVCGAMLRSQETK